MPQKEKKWWDPKNWAEEQALRVAQEVYRLRGQRSPGSAQWLADRTKALGYAVSRSVITDLENGRRRYVTTAELAILAQALNTAPIALLYPAPYDNESLHVVPLVKSSKAWAAQWFSGLLDGWTISGMATTDEGVPYPLSKDIDGANEYKRIYDENLLALRVERDIWELAQQRNAILADAPTPTDQESSEKHWEILEAAAKVDKRIKQLRDRHGG